MKLSFLGLSLSSVELKSKLQSPGAWQMVVGVDVSRNSTENRCFQGSCRGVVARKSRTEAHRPYADVFIVKSGRCFWHTGRSVAQGPAVPSGRDGAVPAVPAVPGLGEL